MVVVSSPLATTIPPSTQAPSQQQQQQQQQQHTVVTRFTGVNSLGGMMATESIPAPGTMSPALQPPHQYAYTHFNNGHSNNFHGEGKNNSHRMYRKESLHGASESTYTVYVSGLDPSLNEVALAELFSEAGGNIVSTKVIVDAKSSQHGGLNYGFVTFDNRDDAKNALGLFNGRMVHSGMLRTRWASQPHNNSHHHNHHNYNHNNQMQQSHYHHHQKHFGRGNFANRHNHNQQNRSMDSNGAAAATTTTTDTGAGAGGARASSPAAAQYNLFVGDVSAEINDKLLQSAFGMFPSLTHARIMWDKRSGKSRGFGFVSFSNLADAESALEHMQGHVLGSRTIRLGWANQKQGANGISGNGRSMPFVEGEDFSDNEGEIDEANVSINNEQATNGHDDIDSNDSQLQPRQLPQQQQQQQQGQGQGQGQKPLVNKSASAEPNAYDINSFNPGHPSSAPPLDFDLVASIAAEANCTVYAGNLTPYTTPEQLHGVFSKYGQPHDIRLQADRGFVFVRMDSHSSAAKAIVGLNGHVVNGRPLKLGWGRERTGYHSSSASVSATLDGSGSHYDGSANEGSLCTAVMMTSTSTADGMMHPGTPATMAPVCVHFAGMAGNVHQVGSNGLSGVASGPINGVPGGAAAGGALATPIHVPMNHMVGQPAGINIGMIPFVPGMVQSPSVVPSAPGGVQTTMMYYPATTAATNSHQDSTQQSNAEDGSANSQHQHAAATHPALIFQPHPTATLSNVPGTPHIAGGHNTAMAVAAAAVAGMTPVFSVPGMSPASLSSHSMYDPRMQFGYFAAHPHGVPMTGTVSNPGTGTDSNDTSDTPAPNGEMSNGTGMDSNAAQNMVGHYPTAFLAANQLALFAAPPHQQTGGMALNQHQQQQQQHQQQSGSDHQQHPQTQMNGEMMSYPFMVANGQVYQTPLMPPIALNQQYPHSNGQQS